MKKFFLLTAFVIVAFCTTSNTDFAGIEGLKLGADFNDLDVSKSFIKFQDDEYVLKDRTLDYQIGPVSDIRVKTKKGKVSVISFTTNEKTDILALNKALKNYLVNPVDIGPGVETIKLYQTTENTVLTVAEVMLTGGKRKDLSYMYVLQNKTAAGTNR